MSENMLENLNAQKTDNMYLSSSGSVSSSNMFGSFWWDEIAYILGDKDISRELKTIWAILQQGNNAVFESVLTQLGSIVNRNPNPGNISMYNAPYRTTLTGGIETQYANNTTGARVPWGELNADGTYLSGTRVQADGTQVDFYYPELIQKSLLDGIANLKLRELVPLQNNSMLGGLADFSKTILQGMWGKVQAAKLTPPIMVVVKGLEMIIAGCQVALMHAQRDGLNGYDNLANTKLAYTGTFSNNGFTTRAFANAAEASPELYTQWITMNQYVAMSLNTSYASGTVTSAATMFAAAALGAHVFVPIYRSMIADGFDALAYALAFTGFNRQTCLSTATLYDDWYPWHLTSAYDLPNGFALVGAQQVFYITFVVMDSINTSAIVTPNVTIPPSGTGFTDSTVNISAVYNSIGDLGYESTRSSMLQMLRMLSGSQFARALLIASIRSFRTAGVWANAAIYTIGANSVSTTFQAANLIVKESRRPLVEYPSTTTGTTYPVVTNATMKLPYNPDDVVLWMLGCNSVQMPTLFQINNLAGVAFAIASFVQARTVYQELMNNMYMDWVWSGTDIELATTWQNVDLLFPKDKFAFSLILPILGNRVYPMTALSGFEDTTSVTWFFMQPRQNPIFTTQDMRKFFSSQEGKSKLVTGAENVVLTTLDTAARYPWYATTTATYNQLVTLLYNGATTVPINIIMAPQNYYQGANYTASPETNPWQPTGDEKLLTPRPLVIRSYGTTLELCILFQYPLTKTRSAYEYNVTELGEVLKLDDTPHQKPVLYGSFFRAEK